MTTEVLLKVASAKKITDKMNSPAERWLFDGLFSRLEGVPVCSANCSHSKKQKIDKR